MPFPWILAFLAASAATRSATANEGPTIDLGPAGKYRGVFQNNGMYVIVYRPHSRSYALTLQIYRVESWKGIPYAKPPVGSLRFMPPQELDDRSDSSIVDVKTDPLLCIQFTRSPTGPAEEDCLKIHVRKPTKANASSSLPVLFNIHVRGTGTVMDARLT